MMKKINHIIILILVLLLVLAGCSYKVIQDNEHNISSVNMINQKKIVLNNSGDNSSLNNTYFKENIQTHSKLTINLKTKLIAPKNNQIYFGAFPDFGGPEDNITKKRIIEFEKITDKNITWAYFSQNWFNEIKYPKKSIHIIEEEEIIPFVRLMPRSDEEQFKKENNFNMKNIIDGKFDNELKQWAKDAKKDFEETNIPLLIDFAVESNGDWFSWSGFFNGAEQLDGYGDINYPDGPERYRDAYRHIIDLFREENVTHITWFFHADIYSEPDKEWNQPKYYYPGDEYIDWIGFSIYGPQNPAEDYWETFSEILEDRYQSILDISSNKPIAILEFGVTDNHPLGNKNEWLYDAFNTILNNNYINFSAISYWNENWEEEDDLFATIRIDSSKKSLDSFRYNIKNKRFISKASFGNSLEKLSKEKIIRNISISRSVNLNKFNDIDLRSFQHGINILKLDKNNYISIWASSGLIPTGENKEQEWIHDVYYSKFNASNPKIVSSLIISAPGAQEPASSTITKNNHIIITMEDDYNVENNLAQTYAIFDDKLNPIKKYQNIVYDGGHSGHIASVGDNFIIFYSDGWVDEGGVDNLGSGDDVMLKTFDTDGNLLFKKDVAVGNKSRDWWPLISGSNKNTMLVWQHFVENKNYAQLIFRIYNPLNNSWITPEYLLENKILYYNYDIQYLEDIDSYIITGNSNSNIGFLYLISASGKVIIKKNNLPAFVREAHPAISNLGKDSNSIKIVYPTKPSNLVILEISKLKIKVLSNENINYNWSYIGTDGVFLNKNEIYFLTLSPEGLVEIKINLKEEESLFNNSSKLLLKSGFENEVYLDEPISDEGEIWWQEIQCSDIDGFNWPIFSDISQESMLQLIVDYDKDINKYIKNEIRTTTDNSGKETQALFQNILKKQYRWTQNPYIIYTNNTEIEDLYIKYSMKFPESLADDIGKDGWTVLTEFKTTTDYRLALYVYKDGDDEKLYWYMHGDNVVDEPQDYNEYWFKENYIIPVPIDEWFDVEIFWHRSTKNDGRVLWKINNKTIADYHGSTKIKDPINAIMVFTNYASNPHEQWIDNIEIRDSIPTNEIEIISNLSNDKIQIKPGISWQWQLSGDKINTKYDVDLYDLDLEEVNKETIDNLHKRDIKVICYFNAGAYEPYRTDSTKFSEDSLGNTMDGWEDEKWLDIAHYEKFSDIMKLRLDMAVEKGCDGVEPDNIQGYLENTGFSLNYNDQLEYNIWLAKEAHKRDLIIALKNEGEQVKDLINYFDFAIVESCFQYEECEPFSKFIQQEKAVLEVEYDLSKNEFCEKAKNLNFSSLKMNLDLDGTRDSCT